MDEGRNDLRSHHGEHHFERYASDWTLWETHNDPIYINYHYGGDIEWQGNRRRNLTDGYRLVLATDGLRTIFDFNHETGLNVLRGDGSVRWREDVSRIFELLPDHVFEITDDAADYNDLWDIIEFP